MNMLSTVVNYLSKSIKYITLLFPSRRNCNMLKGVVL